jgi:hypothetical protein
MGIASFLLVLRGVLYTKNVRSATLRLGGYYMPGGTISKGGTICQFIRYLSELWFSSAITQLVTGTTKLMYLLSVLSRPKLAIQIMFSYRSVSNSDLWRTRVLGLVTKG